MYAEGKIFDFLTKLGDMFLLNIVYLISCIPIFTIGAATTALYYNTLKMAENREGYVVKDYWRFFKQNFKQATIIWLLMLVIIIALGTDILMIGEMSQLSGLVVGFFVIVVGIIFIMVGVYVFPVLARFDNTVKNIIKNSMIMAVRHLPSTVLIIIIHGLPLLLLLASPLVFIKGLPVVLLFTTAILAFWESKLFSRIFSNYYPKEEDYDFAYYNKRKVKLWKNRQK